MMEDAEVVGLVKRLVSDAESYRDQLSKDRSDATDYYNGEMKDFEAGKGKSSMVAKTVRTTIKKVLPSVKRTMLGNAKVFEYSPSGEGDEEGADQATDYINHVIFPEADGPNAVYDAFHDAMLLRTGIVKVSYEELTTVKVSTHTGLTDEDLPELVGGDSVEVIEQNEEIEQIETPMGLIGIPIYSVKIRRSVTKGAPTLRAVKPEQFLIYSDAKTIEGSSIVGESQIVTRSDLVSMGYDKDHVESLKSVNDTEDALGQSRDDRVDAGNEAKEKLGHTTLDEIRYYELYVRVDRDGDGIGELLRMCFGGAISEDALLDVQDWDEQPFVDFICERQPHQWQGASIADDTMDIQKVQTSLTRATLDNLYWQNRPQPIVQEGAIENEDAVLNPEFGKPIRITQGLDISKAIGFTKVPFVAAQSFDMLGYFDDMSKDRTGISDASSGMAPDALQNMTAKASAMMESAGVGQTELMVSTLSGGLKKVGAKLLKLTIQHQDKPRTVRLRDEWVEYDPRSWNAEMDVGVNTGLGAGTRERDMQMLQLIKMDQKELLQAFGPNNPYVTPENLYNTLEKSTEAAGFASAAPFFTKPDPEEIKQKLEAQANKPNPEQMKIEAQMKLEQAKMQTNSAKEQAQMQADLQVKQAEIQADGIGQQRKLEADAVLAEQKNRVEREKMAQNREIEEMKLNFQREKAIMEFQQKEAMEIGAMLEDIHRKTALPN